ncbi:MAG: PH domain-containing protein [Actinomycetota bacterium]
MAQFPKKLLADHEKIVFDLKPHWVALVAPVLWTIALSVVWWLALKITHDNLDRTAGYYDTLRLAIGILLLSGIFYLGVFPFLQWTTTHFVLTTDRLITRHGIIAKHSREIPLERINDVAFSQSVLERFLGAGDLMIESAGERGQSRITNVRKPEDVQLMIYKTTEANNNRMMRGETAAGASAPAPEKEASVIEQIEQLKKLADSGAITELEYENKKQELLKRL